MLSFRHGPRRAALRNFSGRILETFEVVDLAARTKLETRASDDADRASRVPSSAVAVVCAMRANLCGAWCPRGFQRVQEPWGGLCGGVKVCTFEFEMLDRQRLGPSTVLQCWGQALKASCCGWRVRFFGVTGV